VCLNRTGAPIAHAGGLYVLRGAGMVSRTAAAAEFIVRVKDLQAYLARNFGEGRLIYDARADPNRIHLGGRKHVQGIVVFEWLGSPHAFGASGHVDLFSVMDRGANMEPQFVPACEGTCYWLQDKGPMVARLWETRP
jgi:hypothetical protein